MSKKDEWDPRLIARLEELKDMPARDPQTAALGRARFLAEAAAILEPVSARERQRHKDWRPLSRKERLVMNAVISIVVALVALLSGGVMVAAAQDDLPNQPLYQVKLFSEDARLWRNTDPQAEVVLLMELSQIRVQEMSALIAMGVTPPAQVTERLNQHIDQALQTAAGMDEDAMQKALLNMQTTLRQEEQEINRLQMQTSGETSQAMAQVSTMLENSLTLIETGIADPQELRNTYRNEKEWRADQTGTPPYQNQPSGTPTPGGNGNQDPATPQGPGGTDTPQIPGGTDTPQVPVETCGPPRPRGDPPTPRGGSGTERPPGPGDPGGPGRKP
jgi:hypothetical protein